VKCKRLEIAARANTRNFRFIRRINDFKYLPDPSHTPPTSAMSAQQLTQVNPVGTQMHHSNVPISGMSKSYHSRIDKNVEGSTEFLAPGGLHVSILDICGDARWDRFVDSHPDGLIYHHSAWLRTLEAEYDRKCVSLACEDSRGRICGILPLFYTRGFPFNLGQHQTVRRLSSLPRTPVAGPLFTDSQAATGLMQAAKQLACGEVRSVMEIKTQTPSLDEIAGGVVCRPWRPTYVLCLDDSLLFGNSRNRARIKWAVGKASKMGVRVRAADTESDLRSWYQIYLRTMRRNLVPPRSYRFFAKLWELLRPLGLMNLLLAELNRGGESRLLAGSIFFSFKETMSYVFNGSREEDFSLHSNDIIIWHAIQDARNNGLKCLDFGEVAEGHSQLAQFKTKWGSEPKQLYRYYYPQPDESSVRRLKPDSLDFLFKAAWGRMPLWATAKLGDWLYSYL
jgi:hypothetical protein